MCVCVCVCFIVRLVKEFGCGWSKLIEGNYIHTSPVIIIIIIIDDEVLFILFIIIIYGVSFDVFVSCVRKVWKVKNLYLFIYLFIYLLLFISIDS